MNTQDFLVRKIFDDLEISCSDGISLYIPRVCLSMVSPYFAAMFANNTTQSASEKISLKYESKILVLLFNSVIFGFCGENLIRREFFKKLETTKEVCDFFSACDEYKFTQVKRLADIHFSSTNNLIKFFSDELVATVHKFNLAKMTINIKILITRKQLKLENLNFATMECETLNFFWKNDWMYYLTALQKWSQFHDPTDEELENTGIFLFPFNYVPTADFNYLLNIVRKFTRAPNTKAKIYEKILNRLFPLTQTNVRAQPVFGQVLRSNSEQGGFRPAPEDGSLRTSEESGFIPLIVRNEITETAARCRSPEDGATRTSELRISRVVNND